LLEVAAGTGIVIAALALALPRAQLIATDLNQPMLDRAATKPELRGVESRQVDALALPFDDQSFDAVVCQFVVMFRGRGGRYYAVALLAHRTALYRDLFRVWYRRLELFVRAAGDRVHPGGGRTPERARPHGTCERHALPSCDSLPGAVLLRPGSTAPSRGSGGHGMPACRRTSPRSNSRGCCSVQSRLVRRHIDATIGEATGGKVGADDIGIAIAARRTLQEPGRMLRIEPKHAHQSCRHDRVLRNALPHVEHELSTRFQHAVGFPERSDAVGKSGARPAMDRVRSA
jgi:hypothetical protein